MPLVSAASSIPVKVMKAGLVIAWVNGLSEGLPIKQGRYGGGQAIGHKGNY